ncbi:hypothetical protein BY996DRAFT_6426776 [Phakopsora pachyrhizi]|nr:hypothetical protein BY996DRAFT_6426776 [Phakopsora pachyrhizi]
MQGEDEFLLNIEERRLILVGAVVDISELFCTKTQLVRSKGLSPISALAGGEASVSEPSESLRWRYFENDLKKESLCGAEEALDPELDAIEAEDEVAEKSPVKVLNPWDLGADWERGGEGQSQVECQTGCNQAFLGNMPGIYYSCQAH